MILTSDNLNQALNLNWKELVINIFVIILALQFVLEKGQWFLSKFGIEFKAIKEKQADHELLLALSNKVKILEEKKIFDSLDNITISLDNIIRNSEASMTASKEALADKINDKYKKYLDLEGIPEDEYEEFVSLHMAYKGVGGNHTGDAKFEYCIQHLPILPTEKGINMSEIKHKNS